MTLRLSALLLACAAPASAQLIPIRTIPLAQGDQYLLFPANNLGMGGVSIALADSLLDPFRNPAMGVRLGGSRLFSAPAIYSISRQSGAGRTLPLASMLRAGPWFGGLSVAFQQVETSQPLQSPPIPILARGSPTRVVMPGLGPEQRTRGNTYAFASLGRAVSRTGLSVGGSVLWSRLRALDAVDLLYPGSVRIGESGNGLDARLGVLQDWTGSRSLEVLVVHHGFRMAHDVIYLDQFWDPGTQQFVQVPRVEHNRDRATTWGLHVAYQRPLAASGWRIGWLATANHLSQPRIAEDEIVTIGRDQGRSSALNLGIGVAKLRGAGKFGIDAVYEPIWSSTWAVAAAPVVTALGDTVPTGDRTVVNRFRFSNAIMRLGFSHDVALARVDEVFGFDLGLAVRAIHYRLAQRDHVADTEQRLSKDWVEWTPSWGLSLRFPDLEVRYRGRVTNGTGRPGTPLAFPGPLTADVSPGSILLVPAEPLSLTGVTTVTHQVSLSLPLR
jgi:hypothetical protein